MKLEKLRQVEIEKICEQGEGIEVEDAVDRLMAVSLNATKVYPCL